MERRENLADAPLARVIDIVRLALDAAARRGCARSGNSARRAVPRPGCVQHFRVATAAAARKHDQCIRFNKLDVHTRSAATLNLARSARIADTLKIADPVQSERCTVCHEPFQAQSTTPAIAKALNPAAGLNCENCHGPAQNWLLSHTRPDFTHQDRVHAGHARPAKSLHSREHLRRLPSKCGCGYSQSRPSRIDF